MFNGDLVINKPLFYTVIILLILLSGIIYFSLIQQTKRKPNYVTLYGKIVDCENKPVKAYVYFSRAETPTLVTCPIAFTATDSNGSFSITLPSGLYLVEVYAIGYEVREIIIDASSNSKVTIRLFKLSIQIPDYLKNYYSKILILYDFNMTESIPAKESLIYLYNLSKACNQVSVIVFTYDTKSIKSLNLPLNQSDKWIVLRKPFPLKIGATPSVAVFYNNKAVLLKKGCIYNYLFKLVNILLNENITLFNRIEINGTLLKVTLNKSPLRKMYLLLSNIIYNFSSSTFTKTTCARLKITKITCFLVLPKNLSAEAYVILVDKKGRIFDCERMTLSFKH